jgi:hypothetical protein
MIFWIEERTGDPDGNFIEFIEKSQVFTKNSQIRIDIADYYWDVGAGDPYIPYFDIPTSWNEILKITMNPDTIPTETAKEQFSKDPGTVIHNGIEYYRWRRNPNEDGGVVPAPFPIIINF